MMADRIASPLCNLFRFNKYQQALNSCWEELKVGNCDWAHLAYTMWPDRVREQCKTNLSLAVAHGLESNCQVSPTSDPDGDGVNNLDELVNGTSPVVAEAFSLNDPTLLTDGAFRFLFFGPVNGRYRAQYRTNLNLGTWTTLRAFTNIGGSTLIVDTNAPLNLQRFYRGFSMP